MALPVVAAISCFPGDIMLPSIISRYNPIRYASKSCGRWAHSVRGRSGEAPLAAGGGLGQSNRPQEAAEEMQPLKNEADPGPPGRSSGGNGEDSRNQQAEEKETKLTTCTVEQDTGEHVARASQ